MWWIAFFTTLLAIESINCAEFFIVNGTRAVDCGFSHHAALFIKMSNKRTEFCGGSILNDRWILTAGHCVRFEERSLAATAIQVTVGSVYSRKGVRYAVEVIITHSLLQVTPTIVRNDIALLKTRVPIVFNDKVQPISINSDVIEAERKVMLCGWGKEQANATTIPQELKCTTMETMDRNTCFEIMLKILGPYEGLYNMLDDFICAWSNKSSACSGDSGSPLILNKKIIGVASFGLNCSTPNAFTKMSKYQEWIFGVMAMESGHQLSGPSIHHYMLLINLYLILK